MLRELRSRGLRHDRSELRHLGDEAVGGRVFRKLRVELREGINRLETGLAVERPSAVPQLVVGPDEVVADQIPDREAIAAGEAGIPPPVLAPHWPVCL